MHVTAADGYTLAATRHDPAGESAGVVLVVGAMGVSQRYYTPFAQWLAAQGLTVFTFDYRGIGRSAPPSLRGFPATLTDWYSLDCAAMLEAAAGAASGKPVIWLGHSLGAQVLPLVPGVERVSRLAMVASGNGYWRLHDASMMAKAALLWFAVAPPAIAAAGYFPGARLGMVGDLPAGVMRQWRRWCLDPRYAAGVERAVDAYAAFTTPIASLSFTDDEMMSARNTDGLHQLFSAAPLDSVRVAPHDVGASRIGHFGAFRPECSGTVWPRILSLLTAPS